MSVDGDSPSGDLSEFETQFVPRSNDDEVLWEVVEIVAERGKKYQVRWAGKDPKTGKPWPLDWVPKRDCTNYLVKEWKKQKAGKRRRSKKTGKFCRYPILTRIISATRWSDHNQITFLDVVNDFYDHYLPKDALCFRRQHVNRRRGTPTSSVPAL